VAPDSLGIDGKVEQFLCNCFTAGTMVETDEGEIPIEEIKVGDKVLAKDDVTGEVAYKEVEILIERTVDEVYNLTFGNEIISTTEEHPFWIIGKGWTKARELQIGDLLTTSDGQEIAIANIEVQKKRTKVHNLKVKDFHTFYVSNLKVWTHNCTPAINMGNAVHYDKLNGGQGTQLPTYLQKMFPNTEFDFTRRGQKGADVKVTGGTHPSQYSGSFWNPKNNSGDFKPDTPSGTRRFNRQFPGGGVERLPYDPNTGKPKF
jgi:hypothetical protein